MTNPQLNSSESGQNIFDQIRTRARTREHAKKATNTSPNVNVEGSGTDSAVTVRRPPMAFPEPLKRLAKVSPPGPGSKHKESLP